MPAIGAECHAGIHAMCQPHAGHSLSETILSHHPPTRPTPSHANPCHFARAVHATSHCRLHYFPSAAFRYILMNRYCQRFSVFILLALVCWMPPVFLFFTIFQFLFSLVCLFTEFMLIIFIEDNNRCSFAYWLFTVIFLQHHTFFTLFSFYCTWFSQFGCRCARRIPPDH